MPKPTPDPKLWKNIAAMLGEMDEQSLRGLVHDLYKLTPENRAFLAAWIGDEDASAELLDGYKAKITAQFVSRGGPRLNGGCDLSLCRRLIKEYRRVTTAPEFLGGFDMGSAMTSPTWLPFSRRLQPRSRQSDRSDRGDGRRAATKHLRRHPAEPIRKPISSG